jgi:hypothetical protein
LRDAGLVQTQRDGRQIYYSLNQDAIAVCCGTLMQVFAPDRVENGVNVRLTDITVN